MKEYIKAILLGAVFGISLGCIIVFIRNIFGI